MISARFWIVNPIPAAAQPDQKQAIRELEAAKAALDKQAAAIEQRRDDIAKLEDARRDLEKLAAAEKQLAADAKPSDSCTAMAPVPRAPLH